MSLFTSGSELFEDSWNNILADCSTNTVFITPHWQEIWWNRFGDSKKTYVEHILDNSENIGIVPLMLNENALTFIGDSDLYDYMDFPHIKGKESLFFEDLWKFVSPLDWEIMRLESIPENSATLTYLKDIAINHGCEVDLIESEKTPFLELPCKWDDYVSQLRKKDRHELRRKIRRLENNGAYQQLKFQDAFETLEESMSCFFELMSMSSHDKKEFLAKDKKMFFMEIAFDLLERSQFDLFFMEIEGEKVAGCICFDYDDQYLLYNSGYRTDMAHLSVGLLNKAFTIRHAIDIGKKEYNFLKGTERYKYQLGAKDRSVFDLVIQR